MSAEAREQEKLAQEELVREKVDAQGNKWRKVYFGGGAHFQNWLEQCRGARSRWKRWTPGASSALRKAAKKCTASG